MRIKLKIALLVLALFIPINLHAQISTTTCPGAGCVDINVGGQGSIAIQITGVFVGTITFQGSVNNVDFVSLNLIPVASSTATSTTTGTGVWSGSIAGLSTVRVVFTAYMSGSANVSSRTQQSAKSGGGGGSSGAPTDATYITQTSNATLSAEQALSSLSSGIMRVATATGVITSLTDSAGIAANISDETGSGKLVFDTTPVFTTSVVINEAAGSSALTLTGATQTASFPALAITQTWNNAAVTFTGVNIAITDTASNANSRLISIKRGATEVFGIRTFEGATFLTSATTENPLILTGMSGGQVILGTDSTGILNVASLTSVSRVNVGSDTGSFGLGVSQDVLLFRDAADVLAQRRTTVAQEYRIYGYFSSATSRAYGVVKSVKEAVTLSGATTATANIIPVGAFVIGVATTTTTTITGASGYQVGDGSDADRWGDITGTAIGTSSDNTNSTANPTGYFAAASAITLTAKTSNFTGGVVQVVVYYLTTGAD